MAFGDKVKGSRGDDGAIDSLSVEENHTRDMPDFIPKELKERLMSVEPDVIRKALTGMLADSEVEATITRLVHIQQKITGLDESAVLKDDEWTAEVALKSAGSPSASYAGSVTHSKNVLMTWYSTD